MTHAPSALLYVLRLYYYNIFHEIERKIYSNRLCQKLKGETINTNLPKSLCAIKMRYLLSCGYEAELASNLRSVSTYLIAQLLLVQRELV